MPGGAKSWCVRQDHQRDNFGLHCDFMIHYAVQSTQPIIKILSTAIVPKEWPQIEFKPEGKVSTFLNQFYNGPWNEHPQIPHPPLAKAS